MCYTTTKHGYYQWEKKKVLGVKLKPGEPLQIVDVLGAEPAHFENHSE